MSEHFENFASYIMGNDDSELAKVKAERDYALHSLEREIAINASLRGQLAKRTDGLKRIERGATSVLLDAALNDDPIGHDVLQEILKDATAALTDDQQGGKK